MFENLKNQGTLVKVFKNSNSYSFSCIWTYFDGLFFGMSTGINSKVIILA